MEHDVFISHAHKDEKIADAICKRLESAKLKCWMTPRDVSASDDRRDATRNAIGCSHVMLLVLSENANAAPHIEREIAHAFYTRRTIIPFRLSNTVPRRSFLFYLDNASWFDASSPEAEHHLDALALRITDLLPGRSVAENHRFPPETIRTATPSNFRDPLMGALRVSHYRTLKILKRSAIAAFGFAVLCFLCFGFRQNSDLSLPRNNFQSTGSGPNGPPEPSSWSTGDPSPSKAGLTFTRFGLWEPAGSSPAVIAQDFQQTPPPSQSAASGDATPVLESDVDRKKVDGSQRLAARHIAPLTSGQKTQIVDLPKGPSGKKRLKGRHGVFGASGGSKIAKNENRAESEKILPGTHPKWSEGQDVWQSRQMADLVTKQNRALEAQLRKAQEETQEAQRIADLATRQRSALEAELRKVENVQNDPDIAPQYKGDADLQSRKNQENVQAVQENGDLAATKCEPGQIEPPNPDQNETSATSTQPLDPPGHPVRP